MIVEHSTHQNIWTRPFFMALLNNFFLFLVFYSLLTILPLYVLDELHGTEGQAGLATTVFLLSAIIVRPFSGKIIELLGKKKTLILSVFMFGISSFIYFWVNDFYFLMGLRFFHGIWFSIGSTVMVAIAADMIPANRKGEGLGYFAMSMNLAVVVGPFLSLALLQWIPYTTLFMGLAWIIVIGFLCSFGIQVTENEVVEQVVSRRLTLKDLIEVKAIPIALVGFLTSFAYSGIMSFISVYAKSVGLFESVSLFFVVFAAAMLLSRPYTGRLFDRSGPNAVIYPSLIIFAFGLILLSFTHSVVFLLVSGTLIGLGYGALLPSFQTMSIQAAPKRRTGHATATFFIFYDLGIAVGSFVLGLVSSQLGFSALYIICSGVVLVTVAAYKIVTKRRTMALHQEEALEL
ncbi:MFS transporter [Rossellomorea vietnamensis]|uniref:MFS transporter n=1 Tax=Rossellomorea vietnamensis TaxID=218284 RepID=UPI00077C2E18